ncbi:site-specific DNA-methyltransferase [Methylobacterium durans]|uniref:site-specific DNA-methyltransferase n=1 Tax=Methylobacterium durans TaxID=2202825 RepID=UPI001F3551D4|nr:site-specific DNA-methyltransferase [Methylobacterium durans]
MQKAVETLLHDEASRKNIPTAELQSFAEADETLTSAAPAAYKRARPLQTGQHCERDPDLDPQIVWNGVRIRLTSEQVDALVKTGSVAIGDSQLVWRGKDQQDWSDLIVQAPPIYIQEKVHPKAIVEDLRRASPQHFGEGIPDLFSDFDELPAEARTEFYRHDQHWSNRMILGDSLQVMASLAEREALKGKIQCIYFDPPYGIKFNSNWQVSTQSRDVKDGKQNDISREPEQIKAFRDTWKDGVHSYLTYLRDRLSVMRELLTESGSVFVQIGDENVHRVRAVMDEVFGSDNFVSLITVLKTSGAGSPAIGTKVLASVADFVIWYARDLKSVKYRQLFLQRQFGEEGASQYTFVQSPDCGSVRQMSHEEKRNNRTIPPGWSILAHDNLTSQTGAETTRMRVEWCGANYSPSKGGWKTNTQGMSRLAKAYRLLGLGKTLRYKRLFKDFDQRPIHHVWSDLRTSGFAEQKTYVVQTNPKVIERCILMATDPGDLVLDPTCGSGTTATVSEQWGRRWITIDTSRVALALARTRLMSARYPYYLLADSPEGRAKEQAVSGRPQPMAASLGDIRQGFVCERAPHVTLKSIANNAEIDVIWDKWQVTLEPLREQLNALLGTDWEEWQIPPEPERPWDAEFQALHAKAMDSKQPLKVRQGAIDRMNAEWEWDYTLETLPERPVDDFAKYYPDAVPVHAAWWEARIARQREIDASIGRAADVEMLFDRPYADAGKVRVAGPFTVESLSPHRVIPSDALGLDEEFEALDGRRPRNAATAPAQDFSALVLENLAAAGVQGRNRADRIRFTLLQPWPGRFIGAEGRFFEGEEQSGVERRAAILIGPEFGMLSRPDLVAAAREAAEARFDVLVACAFAYDAHASDLTRLGPITILQAKMNPDLHMADDLKATGKGNLFVVFGEPDIEVRRLDGDELEVEVKGIDVFDPNTGDVRSDDTSGIAAWFIDTDYDEENFFVRHAYFLGANDPYKSLKTALRAEIDEAAWATLYRSTSRPFARPTTGRIAVKVINHFGDEVMKVYGV